MVMDAMGRARSKSREQGRPGGSKQQAQESIRKAKVGY